MNSDADELPGAIELMEQWSRFKTGRVFFEALTGSQELNAADSSINLLAKQFASGRLPSIEIPIKCQQLCRQHDHNNYVRNIINLVVDFASLSQLELLKQITKARIAFDKEYPPLSPQPDIDKELQKQAAQMAAMLKQVHLMQQALRDYYKNEKGQDLTPSALQQMFREPGNHNLIILVFTESLLKHKTQLAVQARNQKFEVNPTTLGRLTPSTVGDGERVVQVDKKNDITR